jgi:hypothetical protein
MYSVARFLTLDLNSKSYAMCELAATNYVLLIPRYLVRSVPAVLKNRFRTKSTVCEYLLEA